MTAFTALIRFRSPAFYRPPFACSQTHFFVSSHQLPPICKKRPVKGRFFGRGSKIRTHDPRFWRPMLYQLSYTPIMSFANLDTYFFRINQVFFCTFNKKAEAVKLRLTPSWRYNYGNNRENSYKSKDFPTLEHAV